MKSFDSWVKEALKDTQLLVLSNIGDRLDLDFAIMHPSAWIILSVEVLISYRNKSEVRPVNDRRILYI